MAQRTWISPLWVLITVYAVHAQTPPSLTSEQRQILQSLPADRQQQVLDALTRSSSTDGRSELSASPDAQANARATTQGLQETAAAAAAGSTRLGPQSTVLIAVSMDEATGDRAAILQRRRARILAGNPYRLNGAGQIDLPSLAPIALGGLTAEEAGQRLNADPRLVGLLFSVSLLPVAQIGVEALEPFGYELFNNDHSSFAPATNIPVPTNYPVGPGDNFVVELFGKKSGRHSLVVDRDGQLHLPELGPMEVIGLSFDHVKGEIEQRVAAELFGVRVSVTMGQLRSIRIFVTGEVNHPGSYMVSGLSTITNALFTSGGVSRIGSLRNVQLKRNGVPQGDLDLYALLLNGDSSGDRRLEPGDVVFVPPVATTAGIAGEVRRPAIYEVRSGTGVGDLIALAGGLAPEAEPRAARLERIDERKQRILIDLDVSAAAGLSTQLRAGDVLTIPRVLDETARSVTLEGEVLRAGKYPWHEQMRLTELLVGLNALKEDADQRYVLIRREHLPSRRISVMSADAVQAFQSPGSAADPLLHNHDRVIVFGLQPDRGVALGEVLEQLRVQARDEAPPPLVSISGRTRAPGEYPLEPGMRIRDLIRAGGGLEDAAYAVEAELIRFDAADGESRRTNVVPVDLTAALRGDPVADVELRSYDILLVKELPDWGSQGEVTLRGEVRFPGGYPIAKGETLSSVIQRAGGLTRHAFAQGSVFTRVEIREQEREQIESMAKRMQADLTTLAMRSTEADASRQLMFGQNLLAQLRTTQPVGRLVIDVQRALAFPGAEDDVQLRAGDTLTVPRLRQYVTVIGEVENPTSHIWKRELTRDYYLDLSGGTTHQADSKRIYVVRADGSVAGKQSAAWFSPGAPLMHTGDTIVVPYDSQKTPLLPRWQGVTQILYNIAIATAAVHAF